ncbi:hypothetical protein SRB5_50710 [Streptomyces sp. RB5]|uniref:Nudix hydrolase domain-containing protein n=1 Tax=Streptomyces smaragdinus TaxID=2585196 RepID=A0A7K0CN37_9ACTN|nr:NUDIX domain-containing protein [Streptomyces smaragdinus]MQY14895.1 hypothetical protein [Streptomyces smaragdinus]
MPDEDYLASYDPGAYPPFAVTIDVVVLTLREGVLNVLLVRRGGEPFAGAWALPGGFVQAGAETLDEAAARELAEETGLDEERGLGRVHLEQLGTYGDPGRDPRMAVVSVAYLAFAPDLPEAHAGSDAADARWTPVAEAEGMELAFDHRRILADGLERARSKIEYTPLATAFLSKEFTVGELRAVYETVWGAELHAGNFHRKVLSVPGFVESTGATADRAGSRGGPRARLYRAGDARLLHPALLRPDREDSVR